MSQTSRLLSANRPPKRYESVSSLEGEEEEEEEDEVGGEEDWVSLVPQDSISSTQVTSLPLWDIMCILSMAFSYGCIMTTLFLITLPVECERMNEEHSNLSKSVLLGIFVAVSGASNLVTPLIGMLSDTYRPPKHFQLGQRMPYFVFGSLCSTIGLLGQYIESYEKLWLRYGIFYFATMIGLNISYAMMLAFIPDQIPKQQIGTANGILALLLVLGSLCGFGIFHVFFEKRIQNMYGLYVCVVIITTILTGIHAHDKDVLLNEIHIIRRPPGQRRSKRRIVFGPLILLKTMLIDPVIRLDRNSLWATYTIDPIQHHDFFIVTISRLCYYCGGSVQTFFLYFLHDIIRIRKDTESSVAYLAVIGQIAGALICYPVGLASDRIFGGQRKPFVYVSCTILAAVTFAMMFATTLHDMVVLSAIFGAGNGIYLTMETSLAVDTLPDHYEDGPSGGHAQLLGIWGVAAFLGAALGPMIGGPLLYFFGRDPNGIDDDDGQTYSLRGYMVILGLSSIYFSLAALSLRWVKKLESGEELK